MNQRLQPVYIIDAVRTPIGKIGGAPIGASGARILTTLTLHLRRTGGGYGLATMCIGVGQGIAVVVHAD